MKHHPGCGVAAATALVRASATGSVRSCSARPTRPPGGRRCRSRSPGTASLPSREVGDVATPAGVDRRGVDGNVAAHQVRPRGGGRVGDGGLLPPARSATAQARGAQQPGQPLPGVPVAATAKPGLLHQASRRWLEDLHVQPPVLPAQADSSWRSVLVSPPSPRVPASRSA
jgi:hypothetical protein